MRYFWNSKNVCHHFIWPLEQTNEKSLRIQYTNAKKYIYKPAQLFKKYNMKMFLRKKLEIKEQYENSNDGISNDKKS